MTATSDKSIAENRADEVVRELADGLSQAFSKSKAQEDRALFEKALRHAFGTKYRCLRTQLIETLARDPAGDDADDFLTRIAEFLAKAELLDKALALREYLLSRFPDQKENRAQLIRIAIRGKFFSAAEAAMDSIGDHKFPETLLLQLRCELALARQQPEEVYPFAKRLQEIAPKQAAGWVKEIQALEREQKWDTCQAAVKAALNVFPDHPWLNGRAVLTRSVTGKEASTLLEKLTKGAATMGQFRQSLMHRPPVDASLLPILSTRVISLRGSARRSNWRGQAVDLSAVSTFKYYDAVDARADDFDPKRYTAFKCKALPHPFRIDSMGQTPIGHLGCSLSHTQTWLEELSAAADYSLIFEDDALVIPSVADRIAQALMLAQNEGYDVVFCGNRASRWAAFDQTTDKQAIIPLGAMKKLHQQAGESDPAWQKVQAQVYGMDATLFSRAGLEKLSDFVSQHGFYNEGTMHMAVGIERYMCDWLSKTRTESSIPERPQSLEPYSEKGGKPYLKAGFLRYPLSITLAELGADNIISQTAQ